MKGIKAMCSGSRQHQSMSAGPEAGQGSRNDGSGLGVIPTGSYLTGDGGGTYTKSDRNPSIQEYESVFGPSARDIKEDPMRSKRHQRWHLPDVLKGPNPYLTDRIDGLITDTTNSPFTSTILPYTYLEHPDAKIKWNVWSFDEGMANRVPYESAARVLTQSKQSFAGYTVRQGLAITMEHNFMMSPEGRVNFSNQLKQMVGSIQYTNDLDVHVALIVAPSYARKINEKYYSKDKNVWQRCRQYVDLFGIMQKTPNALDLIIEDTKATFKSWGSQDPSFLLTNSKLTMQLTMTPERTQYLTQGPDGLKRLADGPNLTKYRGLDIIHSRSFSTETGARPRDLLDRRVRVAEYYVVHGVEMAKLKDLKVTMYDQSKDTMFTLNGNQLFTAALLPGEAEEFNLYSDHGSSSDGSSSDGSFMAPHRGGGSDSRRSRTNGIGKGGMKTGNINWFDHRKSVQKPDTFTNKMRRKYTCSDWVKVAEIADFVHESVHDFIKNNDVYSDDTHKYSLMNALTMPGKVHMDKDSTKLHVEIAWNAFEPIRFINAFVVRQLQAWDSNVERMNGGPEWEEIQQRHLPRDPYIGRRPLGKHVMYLLEDVVVPDRQFELKFHKILGIAMGFPVNQISVFGPETSFFKNSRLFLLNAYFATEFTTDRHLFDKIECMQWDDQPCTVPQWLEHIKNDRQWTAAVNSTFKPKRQETGGIVDTQDDADYWNNRGQPDQYDIEDPEKYLLHLVRQMLIILFGSGIAGNGRLSIAEITMKSCGGVYLGYQFDSSHFFNAEPHPPPGREFEYIPDKPQMELDEDSQKMLLGEGLMDIVLLRPNIEHNMLGVVMGRGGKDDLGATFWGQTELSVYDDGMHGKWGMSYKYHERAIVLNEKNLMRCWDVAFNGYNGGCDDTFMSWSNENDTKFRDSVNNLDRPYDGPSIVCMMFPSADKTSWPNPIMLSAGSDEVEAASVDNDAWIDPENINSIYDKRMMVFQEPNYRKRYENYANHANFPDFRMLHATRKTAGQGANDGVTSATSVAFQGTVIIDRGDNKVEHVRGAGHLGESYVGCASVREGKGHRQDGPLALMRNV